MIGQISAPNQLRTS